MSRCRVVGFVDLDCFYVAVERSRDPSLLEKPVAVVQYETWRRDAPDMKAESDRKIKTGGASLIAVSYEARARGVKRGMSSSEARKVCPDLVTVMVPTENSKASLRIYKEAGQEVVRVLSEFASVVEKRSVDEVAIDVTDEAAREEDYADALAASHLADSDDSVAMSKVSHEASRRGHDLQRVAATSGHAVGDLSPYDVLLLKGAVVVARARRAVADALGFTCSAGIAPTKMLAKIGCGLHKPNQQTVVLPRAIARLLRDMPLDRLPGLGGALGARVKRDLGVETAGDVAALPRAALAGLPTEDAAWLVAVCTGTHAEPVKDRAIYQSFASSKTFFRNPLASVDDCDEWLANFADELWTRIVEDRAAHHRAPTNVTVSIGADPKPATRTEKIHVGATGSATIIANAGKRLLRRWASHGAASYEPILIKTLGLSVSNFEDLPKVRPITGYFLPKPLPLKSNTDARRQQQQQQQQPPAQVFHATSPQQHQEQQTCRASSDDDDDDAEVPPDVDEDVFRALPPNIQAELRDANKRRCLALERGGATNNTNTTEHRPPPSSPRPKPRKRVKASAASQRAAQGTAAISSFYPPQRRRATTTTHPTHTNDIFID